MIMVYSRKIVVTNKFRKDKTRNIVVIGSLFTVLLAVTFLSLYLFVVKDFLIDIK